MKRLAILLPLCLLGCTTQQGDRAIDVMVQSVPVVEEALVRSYELEQQWCKELDDNRQTQSCLDDVRERWEPVKDTMQALRDAWCSVAPEAEGCK